MGRLLVLQSPLLALLGLMVPACSTVTEIEKESFVDRHNDARMTVGASNMQKMSWKSTIATAAQQWTDSCNYIKETPTVSGYQSFGQNIFTTSEDSVDVNSVIEDWTGGSVLFQDGKCLVPGQCDNYIRIIWAETSSIGCAYTYCDTILESAGVTNAFLVTCFYTPESDSSSQVYVEGDNCTQCSSGKGWCHNGLCNSDCTERTSQCDCLARCYCGSMQTDCSCSCSNGWDGIDCTVNKTADFTEYPCNGATNGQLEIVTMFVIFAVNKLLH